MWNVCERDDGLLLTGADNFSLADTLDCGQAFRWSESDGVWSGVAKGHYLRLSHTDDGVMMYGVTRDEFESVWRQYFDLERDNGAIIDTVSGDPKLCEIAEFSAGIRILRQDCWEAICSFIISANNNIPRIKGIISRLCEMFGEPLCDGQFTFPTAERLHLLTVEDLAPLRSGFRAKYIVDAAQKFHAGVIDEQFLRTAPIDQARAMLMQINGVGPKVADCVLLFGCGRIESFPVDVWIRRAMAMLFDGQLPQCALPYAGIVQQYIFHYARMTGLKV